MFGYVRPDLTTLPEDAKVRYRSFYCGLCRALGRRHGQLTRLTLTFDLTYLTIFLGSLYEPEESTGDSRCLPHPVKPHLWRTTAITDYAADMTIALTYHKCLDDWADEHKHIQKLYAEFLGKPNSHKAHELLHTTYTDRTAK